MKICAVICENGLGHFKRTIGLLHYWLGLYPNTKVTVICRGWQPRSVADWPSAAILDRPNVVVADDILMPGVRWRRDPWAYSEAELLDWAQPLAAYPPFLEADLVMSDNLCGVLAYRPDALLLGSFLWMEILEVYREVPAIQRFIDYEQSLLMQCRPPMLCVEMIAMPAVKEYTLPVMLPWWGDDPPIVRKRNTPPVIALAGGATGVADELLHRIAGVILDKTPYQLAVGEQMLSHLDRSAGERLRPFGFSRGDFASCDLMICRAGVGTITDCITARTPMLLLPETDNLEMTWNTDRLREAGLAVSLPGSWTGDELALLLEQLFEPEHYSSLIAALASQPVDGFARAADWIQQHYYH